MNGDRRPRRWPLLFIAAPAAVAVWSGWVGLGEMCGFGIVHPLPGIADGLRLNTAITLPVGMEAYAAYALRVWLDPAGVPAAAGRFARRSAIGALALGTAGQVIYHLLAAAGWRVAPWPVVIGVSCLPVVSLGFGAALMHLLRAGSPAAPDAPDPAGQPAGLPALPDVSGSDIPAPAAGNGQAYPQAREIFAAELAAGRVPSIAHIRSEMHCGQPKAQRIRAYLTPLARAR